MKAALTDSMPAMVDASKCVSTHSRSNQAARLLWGTVWLLFFRPSPRFLYGWRRFLLRLFGARIGAGAVVGARSSVFKDVPPWTIVCGNPARFMKKRELASTPDDSITQSN